MKYILLTVVLLCAVCGRSQTNFYPSVKIEFEKIVYARQLIKERESSWYEMIKDRIPETITSYYDFIGDTAKAIYKPGREAKSGNGPEFMPVSKNTVYSDLVNKRVAAQKPVFEETFLINDSLMKIKWKLTNDNRTIAGFNCRKAIGIVDDSVAIFAFYTDEILIQSGPETIHGLPGMILGVGVPRLHTTWFATKVEVSGVNMNAVTPPLKGKKVTRQVMLESLDKVFKNWGDYGKKMRYDYII